MEGGSPSLIWERWTLPMYYAQCRWWGDNPPADVSLDMLTRTKYKMPRRKKTPPPRKDGSSEPTIDWAALDVPLTPAELGDGGSAVPFKG